MVVFTTGTGAATASCSSWIKQSPQARASSCKPPRAFCSDFCQIGSMSQNSTGGCRARSRSYAPLKGISALGREGAGYHASGRKEQPLCKRREMGLWGLKLPIRSLSWELRMAVPRMEGLEPDAGAWERMEKDWVSCQQDAESGDGRI